MDRMDERMAWLDSNKGLELALIPVRSSQSAIFFLTFATHGGSNLPVAAAMVSVHPAFL